MRSPTPASAVLAAPGAMSKMSHIAFGPVRSHSDVGFGANRSSGHLTTILKLTFALGQSKFSLRHLFQLIGSYLRNSNSCWQIRKNRNAHYLADKPADAEKVIRKSWHRFSIYIRKEWRFLLRKVHLGKIDLSDAE